jgi:antitoxin (DNA-binding transcriptional repressor) of toxin-antitoxin stability system
MLRTTLPISAASNSQLLLDYRGPLTALARSFDGFLFKRYKVPMKTLTITDAKKNLGRLLAAAARGEDIGIICGADIVALRKITVESTDYAQREYGAMTEQVSALEEATEKRYRQLKRRKKLTTVTTRQLREMLE